METPIAKDIWAIVSGGTSGIGRATVDRLAARGIHGVVLDRTTRGALPHGWEHVPLDLTNDTAIPAVIGQLRERIPCPRILVTAAGANGSVPSIFDLTPPEWDRVIDTNLRGTFFLARDVMCWQKDEGENGRIVTVASQLATAVVRPNPHYQISKAGILQLTRVLALEGATCGIQVNAVSPGIVVTPMTERYVEDETWKHDRLGRIPLARFAEPDEIAEVIVAVAMLETSYMTGSEIVIDGGYLLP